MEEVIHRGKDGYRSLWHEVDGGRTFWQKLGTYLPLYLTREVGASHPDFWTKRLCKKLWERNTLFSTLKVFLVGLIIK